MFTEQQTDRQTVTHLIFCFYLSLSLNIQISPPPLSLCVLSSHKNLKKMVESGHNQTAYSLPSELLSDQHPTQASDNHQLPTEFPYDFASFTSPTVEDEEDHFFTGLTRQFALTTLLDSNKLQYAATQTQKKWGMSTSPHSILSPVFSPGSSPTGPFQGPSSPTSPFVPNDHSWSLICEAAGQVNMWNKLNNHPPLTHTGLAMHLHNQACSRPDTLLFNDNPFKKNCRSIWAGPQACQKVPRFGSANGRGFVENVSYGNPNGLFNVNDFAGGRKNIPGSVCGGVKRKSAGTGVFLPRRCPDPVDSRLKSGCPPSLAQQKVAQAMNMDYDGEAQPRFLNSVTPAHDVMVMRRNAVLAQQWRSGVKMMAAANKAMNYEMHLPQEWSESSGIL